MARLSSALLIDPEPKGLATLTFGFVREGCRVLGTSTAQEGIDKAQKEAHDVVVIALREGPTESRELLENLAERNGTPVPLIALGNESHRTVVEAMPSADLLPMPAFIRDIVTAAKLRAAIDPTKKEPVISAPLSEFGVFSLIRSLQATQRSGIIQLERGNHRGELRFSKGELTWAQVGSQQGVPALNQLLLWEEAALEARFRAVVVRRSQFSVTGKSLIEEAERFLRDFVSSAKKLGAASTVYEIVADKAEAKKSDFPPEVAPVLRLFDGKRSLADVLDESPFRVFDTLRIVTRFVDAGVLRESAAAAPTSTGRGVRSPVLEDWLKAPSDDEFVHPTGGAELGDEPRRARNNNSSAKKKAKTSTAPMTTLRSSVDAARERKTSQPPAAAVPLSPPISKTPALTSIAPLAAAVIAPSAAPAPLASAVAPAPTATPAEPAPAAPRAAAGDTRPTGTSLPVARGELRSAAREEKRFAARPSIVLDIPTEAAPTVAAPVAPAPAPPPVTPTTPSPPVAVGVPEPAPVAKTPSSGGAIQARKPADRPARQAGSIEIAADLLADMDALETRPARGRTPAPARAPTPAPLRLTPVPTNRRSPVPTRPRRPSGEFDALEKDFFAREADLYKKDAVEDFSDLDEPTRRGKR